MLITAFAVNLSVPEIRSASRKDGSVITDLGNMIVDVRYVDMQRPPSPHLMDIRAE